MQEAQARTYFLFLSLYLIRLSQFEKNIQTLHDIRNNNNEKQKHYRLKLYIKLENYVGLKAKVFQTQLQGKREK